VQPRAPLRSACRGKRCERFDGVKPLASGRVVVGGRRCVFEAKLSVCGEVLGKRVQRTYAREQPGAESTGLVLSAAAS
jgi:hypothetical protein